MYCRAPFQSLLFCFLILSLVGCDQNSQREARELPKEGRKEAAKELEERRNQVFMEFEKKYNADGSWQGSFKRNPVWTMEVQDRLIPPDGRPILSSGSLYDVTRKGDEYRLHFRKGYLQGTLEKYRLGVVDIDFVFNCSLPEDKRAEAKSFGDQITARTIGTLHDDYVFVAKIKAVERRDKLIGKVAVDNFPHFIATGECLAVKYIGESQNASSKSSVLHRPGETPEQYLNRINH